MLFCNASLWLSFKPQYRIFSVFEIYDKLQNQCKFTSEGILRLYQFLSMYKNDLFFYLAIKKSLKIKQKPINED